MQIVKNDSDVDQLLVEVIRSPIDPAIRYAILSTVAWLTDANLRPTQGTDIWKDFVQKNSKIEKGSLLERFHLVFAEALASRFANDGDIPDFLNSHEECDLLTLRPVQQSPKMDEDFQSNVFKMIRELSYVAIYFMQKESLTEFNLSNKIMDRLSTVEWELQSPRNDTEGLSLHIKPN